VSDVLDIVRAAIPNADQTLAEAILWERTSYPCGSVTPRDLYRAAARFHRASAKGVELCALCDRVADQGMWECLRCARVMKKFAKRS